jgi:guanine deaminase
MVAPVADFLRNGIKVGLGTDSGGGFASGMLDSIRQAIIASNAREVLSKGVDKGLTLSQVFTWPRWVVLKSLVWTAR